MFAIFESIIENVVFWMRQIFSNHDYPSNILFLCLNKIVESNLKRKAFQISYCTFNGFFYQAFLLQFFQVTEFNIK